MRRTLSKGGRLKARNGEEENEEYYPIWLNGITVKPSGNRPTTRDDWNWANWRELQNEREQQAAESVRRAIDRNGTPIAAGIYGLTAAPFAIEGLGSSAVANGVRTGLQAMNTAFTPSTWLNPVTGAKLLSPVVGTVADAGVQGAFAYEGLNGLWNQGRQGTLLSDPASTAMHGLEILPVAGLLGNTVKRFLTASNAANTAQPVTRVKRAYSTPTADIIPVEGNITTSDIPNITSENAVSMTPEQWTAAQDAAIAVNDIGEAQRLRDLHFRVNAPNTQIKDIQYHGAKGNAKFNVFDSKLIGQTDQGWAGRGYYFTPSIDYAKMYGSEPRAFYINAQKVHDGTASTYFGREDSPAAKAFKIIRKRHGNDGQQILDELASSDAIRTSFPQTQPYNGRFEEVVARNNNQMKLADAVTYDDKGVRVPLGERDNFSISDIRYSLLPWILGGGAGTAGYNYLNQYQGPLVEYAMGGKVHRKRKSLETL